MMIRYLGTLASLVLFLSASLSVLSFATRSQVLTGKSVAETWRFDFTLDADSGQTYQVTPEVQDALVHGVQFPAEGPVHVDSAKLQVVPENVYWIDGNRLVSSAGGRLLAHVTWGSPSGTPTGSRGVVFVAFPPVPGIDHYTLTLHSGPFRQDAQGRWKLREVTTYRSAPALFLARFGIALLVAIPLGAFVHTILWGVQLRNERRTKAALLPTQGPQLPHTYYPSPVWEWRNWLLVFGSASFFASIAAGLSVYDGYLSAILVWFIVVVMAAGVALGLLAVYYTRRRVLTVRVDNEGISYAQGRASLDWVTAPWSDLLFLEDKPRSGSLKLGFKGGKKDLQLSSEIENFAGLRVFLLRFANSK